MRPLFTFKLVAASLVWIAATLTAQAAMPPANLTVLAGRGQLFTLVLDGRPLTSGATRQVHVGWLTPGRHWADVQVFSPYGPPIGFRTTVWLQPGLDSRYALTASPYGPSLQALGAVVAGGYAGRGGYGNPYGGPGYGAAPGGYGGAPGSYGGAPGGYGNAPYPAYPPGGTYSAPSAPGGYAAPTPAPYGSAPAAPSGSYGAAPGSYGQPVPSPYPAPQGGYAGQGGYPNQGNYPDQGGYPNDNNPDNLNPLPPNSLRDLSQELREQPSDQARLDVARQALNGSSLQARELAELLRALTTEPARIELAELGYTHLSDPANFGQVYAGLRPASVAQVQRDLELQRAY